ncbi:hypothetical protein CDL12_27105 [Handroanthus impetiginosus]|uniref:Putative plant transposon protein domain-containing protein n=1 Tax=Handroanthus impetiginosus TaxID=429701 RepID=A0A2G9G502_9LAMI|nr:hypothetical protein CDL12_27105 [Handroanthus impetiginosus]
MVWETTINFSSSTMNHLLDTLNNILNIHDEPVGIFQSSLTNEAWDWLRFVNGCLYPSSHLLEVSKDQAVLLYAILTSVPLDIGCYIHNAIRKSTRGGMSVSLYFSSITTAFCQRERLVNLPEDDLIQLNTTINEENPPPHLNSAHRHQPRPHELGMEDKLAHVEKGLHYLQFQHERQILEHQRLQLEQWQCFAALDDHCQISPDCHPDFTPNESDEPGNAT